VKQRRAEELRGNFVEGAGDHKSLADDTAITEEGVVALLGDEHEEESSLDPFRTRFEQVITEKQAQSLANTKRSTALGFNCIISTATNCLRLTAFNTLETDLVLGKIWSDFATSLPGPVAPGGAEAHVRSEITSRRYVSLIIVNYFTFRSKQGLSAGGTRCLTKWSTSRQKEPRNGKEGN